MSGEIPIELSKGSGDSIDSKEFVDPQCEPSANSVDPMEVEGPASSRARPAVNKGKGLASGVQLFRGICKKPRKKRSTIQDMSDSLKSMSDVIVESRSVSTHNTPFRTTATNEMQAIMDMVLSLPRVQVGDRLHMFSTFFFMNNVNGRNMFAVNVERNEVQRRWLEKQAHDHNDIPHSRSAWGTYGGSEGGHYDEVADVAFYLDSNEMKEYYCPKEQPLNLGFIVVRGTSDGILRAKAFLQEVLKVYSLKNISASRMLGDQLALAWIVTSDPSFDMRKFTKPQAFVENIGVASVLFLPCAIYNWTPLEGAG
nr:hypothetical protein CFP56_66319 [Quercus suber]